MNKLNLVIADIDKDCAQSLTEYCVDFEKDFFYKVSGFYDEKNLIEYLSLESPDVLLIDYNLYSKIQELPFKGVLILMNDGFTPKEYESFEQINKFIQGREITNAVISIYSKVKKSNITFQKGSKSCRIVAVYSPIGGCGKSSVAVALAKTMAQAGKKALYINMEDIPSVNLHFPRGNATTDFTEVLYEAIQQKPDIASAILASQNIDDTGCGYIRPPESASYLYDLNREQWVGLWSSMKAFGMHDDIVIDMSTALDMKNQVILSLVDDCVVVSDMTKLGNSKLNVFEKNLNTIKDTLKPELFKSKVIYLINETRNKNDAIKNNKDTFMGMQPMVHIPFDKYLATQGSVNLTYKFGEVIKKVVSIIK